MNKMYFVVAISAALISLNATAQVCHDQIDATASSDRFIVQSNSTVIDAQTGLIWSRCAIGKEMADENTECIGNADSYISWAEALQAVSQLNINQHLGRADWRLPNIKELASIVERKCFDPAIQLSVFPDTDNQKFWSSTPTGMENIESSARIVNFADGTELTDAVGFSAQIRPVAGPN